MCLSRSVTNNLCVLALVGSVVDQMTIRKNQYTPGLRSLHDTLQQQHTTTRGTVLQLASIPASASGMMLLEPSEYRRWVRKEKEFFDVVLKVVPEKTLDARMWLTTVLLVVEEYMKTIPETAEPYRTLWGLLHDTITAIYHIFDPDLECRSLMEDGVFRGEKIMEVLSK